MGSVGRRLAGDEPRETWARGCPRVPLRFAGARRFARLWALLDGGAGRRRLWRDCYSSLTTGAFAIPVKGLAAGRRAPW